MNAKARHAAKTMAKADRRATHAVARHRDSLAVRIADMLGDAADQPQLVTASLGTIAAGLVVRRPDLVRGGARMLAAHLLATAAKTAIKRSFDRTRPETALRDGKHRFAPGGSRDHEMSSFPSGHTAGAVAVARAAAREIDGAAAPAALGVGAIAAIQPVAGNHYLSDVLVGGAIGWLAEAAVDLLVEQVVAATRRTAPDATENGSGLPSDH